MYAPPEKVISPKASVGGPIVVLHDALERDFSVASFSWNGAPVIGIRWNGSEEHPGQPQSRGLPTWFIVPSSLEEAILRALIPLNLPETDGKYESIQRILGERRESKTLKDRVIALKRRFISQHGVAPKTVDFSLREEQEIEAMDRNVLGDLVSEVTIHGARALERFLGLEIQWDRGGLRILGPNNRRMDE